MIESSIKTSFNDCSLMESIRNGEPHAALRLERVFGRSLRCILRHYRPNQLEVCFQAILAATLAAVLAGDGNRDKDLPAVVRKALHSVLPLFPPSAQQKGDEYPNALVTDLRRRLSFFGPVEREALVRFYTQGESAAQLCRDLLLDEEIFELVQMLARELAQNPGRPLNLTAERASSKNGRQYNPESLAG